MNKKIERYITVENGVSLEFAVTEDKQFLFLHCGAERYTEEERARDAVDPYLSEFSPCYIDISGLNTPPELFADQMVHGSLDVLLKYDRMEELTIGKKTYAIFFLRDEAGLSEVALHYILDADSMSVRCCSVIKNLSEKPIGLCSVSSFMLNRLEDNNLRPYREQLALHVIHNGWQKELQWVKYTPEELGLALSQPGHRVNSSKTISFTNVGNWSTKHFIPQAIIERKGRGETLAFEIEHNGSWTWQIGEHEGHVYLCAAGPTEKECSWFQWLQPGETFTTVPVGVVCVKGDAADAAVMLTKYRRLIRRENRDDIDMPVIFNDYMNCLWGDPTTERELPMIDAAADCGCEVYCIDCGWYDDGPWWDGVGEWQPSEKRFPGGLKALLDRIREKGMIPGLWLELEVVGIHSPLLSRVPENWFFMRHGSPIRTKSRYQLDFRNPEVRAFADEVVDRLTDEYGVGYIKMDYNIDAGTGTELNADSAGMGLLDHNRAYLQWLTEVFKRHPDLIIENCSSGGMRMDYAQLAMYSIQSTSDMEDYRTYSTITVNAPLALTPEQAAVWSYSLPDGDAEETVNNMVNTIFLRIHQSGHLANISPERKNMVRDGITYFKKTRGDRVQALPFWPLGFATYETPWTALGVEGREKSYLAVWRRDSEEEEILIPLPQAAGRTVTLSYPFTQNSAGLQTCTYSYDEEAGALRVRMPQKFMARIFEISNN